MQETPIQFLGWEDPPGEGIGYPLQYSWASLVTQTVKNLPAMQETWVWSLDSEDPLEESMATYFNILAWRIPWKGEPGGLQSIGLHRVRHDWRDLARMHANLCWRCSPGPSTYPRSQSVPPSLCPGWVLCPPPRPFRTDSDMNVQLFPAYIHSTDIFEHILYARHCSTERGCEPSMSFQVFH